MAVEGTLDLFRLPEILQVISQERKTGILTVQGVDDIIAVSFLQGRIVAADALNATTEEGLGTVLAEEGRVPESVLQRLASRAEMEGVRLADLLVSEGHLDRKGLLEALRAQTAKLLRSLLDWRRGEFKFYGGDEVSYEEGFRSIGVDELLLASLEDRAAEEEQEVPALETRLRRLEPDRPVRVRAATGLQGTQGGVETDSAVWVTPTEQRLLDAVGPTRTVEEVATEAEVTPERARYLLYRFVREGLVTPVTSSEGRAARPRPARAGRPAPERPVEVAPESPQVPASSPAPRRKPATGARVAAKPRSGLALRLQAAVLASVVAVLMVGASSVTWVAFLLPFPWLQAERAEMHGERDTARLLEIDQAAKTYFLLEGHFPDDLRELVALGLLEPRDLVDSRGRRLAYVAQERSYHVHAVVPGAAADEEETFHEGIGGNFLLDPDFLTDARNPPGTTPPLVLLD